MKIGTILTVVLCGLVHPVSFAKITNCPSDVTVVVRNLTETGGFSPSATVLSAGRHKLFYDLSARITQNGHEPFMMVWLDRDHPFNTTAGFAPTINVSITPAKGHSERLTGYRYAIFPDPDSEHKTVPCSPSVKFRVVVCNNTSETVSWQHVWKNFE